MSCVTYITIFYLIFFICSYDDVLITFCCKEMKRKIIVEWYKYNSNLFCFRITNENKKKSWTSKKNALTLNFVKTTKKNLIELISIKDGLVTTE